MPGQEACSCSSLRPSLGRLILKGLGTCSWPLHWKYQQEAKQSRIRTCNTDRDLLVYATCLYLASFYPIAAPDKHNCTLHMSSRNRHCGQQQKRSYFLMFHRLTSKEQKSHVKRERPTLAGLIEVADKSKCGTSQHEQTCRFLIMLPVSPDSPELTEQRDMNRCFTGNFVLYPNPTHDDNHLCCPNSMYVACSCAILFSKTCPARLWFLGVSGFWALGCPNLKPRRPNGYNNPRVPGFARKLGAGMLSTETTPRQYPGL